MSFFDFSLLILAGFLKVTAPSSTVLLLRLELKLLDIGGGRAGGSFLMRPLRSKRINREQKILKYLLLSLIVRKVLYGHQVFGPLSSIVT